MTLYVGSVGFLDRTLQMACGPAVGAGTQLVFFLSLDAHGGSLGRGRM